jgi:long-chain fatty acid transport protein
MKKIYGVLIAGLIASQTFAGGILTNTNQSVMFIRNPSRSASTDIDAVYYNPAGIVRIDDGFHFALHNQTIFQEKTITSTFSYLNNQTYVGDVTVPSFPTFFAAYKKDKLAISFGFGPNAGGGSAEYKTGLPSFEKDIAVIPAMVSLLGINTTHYSADIYFKGSSIFWGAQLGGSYAINDMFAVSLGARCIIAKNTYKGHIRDIQINPVFAGNPSGAMISAPGFFTAIGQTTYATATSNMEVDAVQKGFGITPFIGLNFNLKNKLNIGIKYEMNTKLELTNEADADKDAHGMFLNDSTFRNDIPAVLAIGVEYSIIDDLRISVSWTHFFDKNADWEGKENKIDHNFYEIGLGLEYDVAEKITLSCGYLMGQTGVGQGYQTDMSYSLSCNTVGFGGRLNVTEKLSIDLGYMYSMYTSSNVDKTYPLGANNISYKETYDKKNSNFAIGFNYKF